MITEAKPQTLVDEVIDECVEVSVAFVQHSISAFPESVRREIVHRIADALTDEDEA